MLSAKRSSSSGALVGAFLLAAGAALVALLAGSDIGALIGVAIAGLAGVLVAAQLVASERQRHEVVEGELSGQASFLESLVESFGAIVSTLEVEEVVELTRSEAGRIFRARARLVEAGDAGEGLVVPLGTRAVQLSRDEPFDRDDSLRARVLGDFAARAIENARLLAEAKVREADRARLSDQLITAEQEERRRLALYLHDTSVQSLSGITLMLDAALDLVRQGRSEDAQEILANVLERQRAAIGGLRDLSFALEPVVLRDQGFAPAVDALVGTLGLKEVELDVAAGEELAERAKAALYQIIREALHASIRRGPPSRVSVRVVELPDRGVELVITDDAPGERRRTTFEPIEERARTLSGALMVEHGADGGTTVRVRLPSYAAR